MVFDHIGLNVKDFPKAKEFFIQALQPLGIGVTMEGEGWAMVGRQGEGNFWFGSFTERQGCGRSITRITTAPSSLGRMDTTSKPYVMPQRPKPSFKRTCQRRTA